MVSKPCAYTLSDPEGLHCEIIHNVSPEIGGLIFATPVYYLDPPPYTARYQNRRIRPNSREKILLALTYLILFCPFLPNRQGHFPDKKLSPRDRAHCRMFADSNEDGSANQPPQPAPTPQTPGEKCGLVEQAAPKSGFSGVGFHFQV